MSEKEKKKILEEHLASGDEMKAVGGVTINWDAKCAATVEDGSSCMGTDACHNIIVTYFRDKAKFGCSATVERGSWCSSDDRCDHFDIMYDHCSADFSHD